MLTAEIIRPDALSARDHGAWEGLRDGADAFRSPLFSPEFAQIVGAVRRDAAVAVYRRGGRAVGFLAHHRRPGGLARPIAAPFCDYHGLVAEPGLDAAEAMRLAGVRAYRFTALVDPHRAFAAATATPALSYAIAIDGGEGAGAEHLERLRAASPKRFKNVRRLDHKLEREVGPIALVAPDRDRATYRQMFAWKRAQFARTGLHDVFAAAWARDLMDRLFDRTEGRLRGYMVSLTVADRPAVVHFGVREGERFHPWMAAQDEALDAYSPGQIFLCRAIEAMPALGLRHYDLAGGHDHYKTPYASQSIAVSAGAMDGRTGLEALAWRAAACTLGEGPAGRVRRRLEQIASVELSLGGRVKGVAAALAHRDRRANLMSPASGVAHGA